MFKIIAETAFSHEGNFSYLLKQIDKAVEGCSDYVKFQVFLNIDEYIVPQHPAYEMLDKWMFTEKEWEEVFKYALSKKIKIIALPLTLSSLDFCLTQHEKIEILEIHSVCFNDFHLVNRLKRFSKKVILGIGGRTGKEVDDLIKSLQKPLSEVILMFGFQSFPTDKLQLNLKKMESFKRGFNCEIGYADHSSFETNDFFELNALSYLLGSKYFEKHIVVVKGEERTDYESAINSKDLINMRKHLEELEVIIGSGKIENLNSKEQVYKNREKQLVYIKNMKKGQVLNIKDVAYKITHKTSDFIIENVELILGKTLLESVETNENIKINHFL